MKQLVIMHGIPGSGKTTKAREWVNNSPETRVRINMDDIRNMLGPYWVPSREKFVEDLMNYAAFKAMNDYGYEVVLDNTNLSTKYYSRAEKQAQVLKYDVVHNIMDTPVDICIERDKSRPKPVGENVIRSMQKRHEGNEYMQSK